jgi:hypothetical protein
MTTDGERSWRSTRLTPIAILPEIDGLFAGDRRIAYAFGPASLFSMKV